MRLAPRRIAFVLTLPAALLAQTRPPDRKPWSTTEIHGPALPFDATVDEGTWMSLDVSPDGKTIVFELLGDLFLVPIGGGTATPLSVGPAWEFTPRFSPDGTRIVFISDRSGSDQIWTIPSTGGTPTQVTRDGANQYGSPTWAPDGQFIIARRGANTAGVGFNAVVMVHLAGGAGSVVLQQDGSGPVASTDGKWLYVGSGGSPYALGAASIVRVDRRTGDRLTIVSGYDETSRPAISRSGRYLVYSVTVDADRRLVMRDLETGIERVLYHGLDRTWNWPMADTDFLPGYAFTPDDAAIVFAAGGKIRRVDVTTAAASVIPFSAHLQQTLTEKVYIRSRIADGAFQPKVLHWAHPVAGGRIVFSATGKLFLYDTAAHTATPFANGPGLQYSPAVSPDGQWIAYVNWSDSIGGHVFKAPIGGGSPIRLTSRPGHYDNVSWSNDSRKLAVAEAIMAVSGVSTAHYQLEWLDATREGTPRLIVSTGTRGGRRNAPRPIFDPSGNRIFYSERTGNMELYSISLNGEDRVSIARSQYGDEMFPSPDGKWLAFTERQDVYLTALPPQGKDPVDVKMTGGAFPTFRMSTEGGDYVYWLDGGKTLAWSWGPRVSHVDAAAATSGAPVSPTTVTVSFSVPRGSVSKGAVVLSNARIVTMKGDEVIERGDIVVVDGRVASVGRSGSVRGPAGATTIDMSGKTIIPGLIDVHAHYMAESGPDVYPEQNTELLANLAYGVTTWREPSARAQTLFALAELVEAGRVLGPRIYSTGDIFFYSDASCCGQPRSLDDARALTRRQKALGAVYIKEHTDPTREQHQWIVQAGREEGMMLAADVTSAPRRDLRVAADGFTSVEHLFNIAPVAKDVTAFFARTGVFYVPTLIIDSAVEEYFVINTNPHDDPKVRRFIPHFRLESEVRSNNKWLMPHDWPAKLHAQVIRDIVRAGGKVALGSHGQVQGIGAHWELWAMASGGVTSLEALRMATLFGAETLGMQDDLGSIETGKLADLVVLDKNPLTDIRNTTSIRYVMKGGTLWSGDTMDEVWPVKRVRPKASWER